jgi:hypothetical protein
VWCVGAARLSKVGAGAVLTATAEGGNPVLGAVSSSPLTRTVGVTRRTGFPTMFGTCKLRRCFCRRAPSMVDGETADAGVGGNRNAFSIAGGSEWARSMIGVKLPELRCMSMAEPSLWVGLAGKVTNGPSRTERLLGGRPRSFPPDELLLLDHAEETAGPCRRLARGLALDGVTADWGSSKKGWADCGVTAESGWGVWGLSCVLSRQRSCWPDMGEAE